MRISDWSSDVCSSDLQRRASEFPPRPNDIGQARPLGDGDRRIGHSLSTWDHQLCRPSGDQRAGERPRPNPPSDLRGRGAPHRLSRGELYGGPRSEEHTSELQSLMRISYAVFCLKKKKKDDNTK